MSQPCKIRGEKNAGALTSRQWCMTTEKHCIVNDLPQFEAPSTGKQETGDASMVKNSH